MSNSELPEFREFFLSDQDILNQFIKDYEPQSCEYNFSNLFCWQIPSKLTWALYKNHVLIYDNLDQSMFMPLGKTIMPNELAELSHCLKHIGLKSDISLVTKEYIARFSEIEDLYIIKPEPDYAEYVYDVNKLSDLLGKKLSKKRNLIAQFKREYPDFEVKLLSSSRDLINKSSEFAEKIFTRQEIKTDTIVQEFKALGQALKYFKELRLEGISLLLGDQVIAFSIFSPLNSQTYDIQFEKSDLNFKGASQIINHETAKYLRDKCQFLNREQDLGIKGLRKAKLSYDPDYLIDFFTLVFKN